MSIGSLSSDLKLITTIEADFYLPGDRICVTGLYRPFTAAGNPGQFDAPEYYFAQNTVGRVTDPEVTLISEGGFSMTRMLARFRRTLRCSYLRILEEKAARTVSAISLGEKSFMEQEWKQLYQEGGISHIISVSGLHISLIGMCIYRLLRRTGLPFAAAALPSAAVVTLYALMSGFGVSAMRACFMFVIWLGAQIAGRKHDMLTASSAAAVVILAGNARAASQASFLLSFGAILSIAVLVPRLQAANPFRESRKAVRACGVRESGRTQAVRHTFGKSREPRIAVCTGSEKLRSAVSRGMEKVWDLISGGAGIWLGTLPVTLWFFYQTAPWSLLVNLAVIPLMTALMASGLISCLTGLVSVSAGTFLAAPVYYLLGLFEWLCALEQKLPCAVWIAGRPAIWKIAVYYALLTGAAAVSARILRTWRESVPKAVRKPDRKSGDGARFTVCIPALMWLLFVMLGVCLMGFHPRSGLTVTCLDVGQGDGALIQFPDGTNCLIDGGSSSVSGLWEYRISQTLKYYGISTIDYAFLSHADSDHISGMEEYLEDYLPGFAGSNAHGITLKNLVLPPTADGEDFAGLTGSAEQIGIRILQMEAGVVLAGGADGETAGAAAAGDSDGETVGKTAAGNFGTGEKGWSLTCLAPSSGALSGDRNEDSMVLLLEYGAFRMLFTGDLENDSERKLAASGCDLSCDVLKVGHHGSNGASSEEFLLQTAPAFGIISCGADNRYGHPGAEATERLRAAGITLYATMDCGAVTIRSDGKGYQILGYIKTEAY